jgi:hypothetical protein
MCWERNVCEEMRGWKKEEDEGEAGGGREF